MFTGIFNSIVNGYVNSIDYGLEGNKAKILLLHLFA